MVVQPGLSSGSHHQRFSTGRCGKPDHGDPPCPDGQGVAALYRAERTIAERLARLANGTLPWPWIDPWLRSGSVLLLPLVMTGGPGVGKTTIVKAILGILGAKEISLLPCAPTGRAAKRMTEATGFEAKTIHRLLEVDPRSGGFKRGEDNPLDCDLLVIDETSMVDVMLMRRSCGQCQTRPPC